MGEAPPRQEALDFGAEGLQAQVKKTKARKPPTPLWDGPRHHPLALCEFCPLYPLDTYVSTSPAENDIFIVGQAPGKDEVTGGRPFVGPSGKQFIDSVVSTEMMGVLAPAGVSNVAACWPGRDPKDPSKAAPLPQAAIKCCAPRLASEIADAKVILALGKEAIAALVGQRVKVLQETPCVRSAPDGRPVVCAVHPAAVLRAPDLLGRLDEGVRMLGAVYAAPEAVVSWEWPPYVEALTPARALALLEDLKGYNAPAVVDIEATRSPRWQPNAPTRLRCIGIGSHPHVHDIVVVGEEALAHPSVRAAVGDVLKARGGIGHNWSKFDRPALRRLGFEVGHLVADTFLATAVVDETKGARGLQAQVARYLGAPVWKPRQDGESKTEISSWYDEVRAADLHAYNAKDVGANGALAAWQDKQGALHCPLTDDLLYPAAVMLERVEAYGMQIDRPRLEETIARYAAEVAALREIASRRIGGGNPNSWQQVLKALHGSGFDVPNTKEVTLAPIRDRSAVAAAILDYRGPNKLLSTYLLKYLTIDSEDRRVHANFNPIGTETGRIACSGPNLANFPREPRDIRNIFWAGEGRVYVYVDISQAETRVIAIESGDEALIEACRSGEDLHAEVARTIWGEGFTSEMRVWAKGINFGLAFDRGYKAIVDDINAKSTGRQLSMREGKEIVDAYFTRFPGIKTWQDSIRAKVAAGEPLRTVFGRIRRFPLPSRFDKPDIRAELERQALAFPSQGTVTDITLKAAILADARGVQIVNLIHDALIAVARPEDAKEVGEVLSSSVREAGRQYTDLIGFPVDAKFATHWGMLG